MAGHQKDPLRPLTPDECMHLDHLSRSRADPAAQGTRAKELLAVADGVSYEAAARAAGRRSGDAVAHLVSRFNREGLNALVDRHGGGQPKRYTQTEQERILQEVRGEPDRGQDGTGTWSLSTIQGALRRAPDGLPTVSTFWCVLHDAGFQWGKDRTWCETAIAIRKHKSGTVMAGRNWARAMFAVPRMPQRIGSLTSVAVVAQAYAGSSKRNVRSLYVASRQILPSRIL